MYFKWEPETPEQTEKGWRTLSVRADEGERPETRVWSRAARTYHLAFSRNRNRWAHGHEHRDFKKHCGPPAAKLILATALEHLDRDNLQHRIEPEKLAKAFAQARPLKARARYLAEVDAVRKRALQYSRGKRVLIPGKLR